MLEKNLKRKLLTTLRNLPGSYFFAKEACALRGIPDIIGCINGVFIAIEVKRSLKDAEKKRDGHVLQDYNLEKIYQAGGIAYKVYIENYEEVVKALSELAYSLYPLSNSESS